MDPLSKLAQTLGVIRQGATDRRTGGTAKKPAGNAPPPTVAGPSSAQRLRVDIAQRLRALAQGAGHRNEAARVIIELVLRHEFGDQARSSAGFADTVRHVQRVMDSDPDLRAELDGLINELIEGTSTP